MVRGRESREGEFGSGMGVGGREDRRRSRVGGFRLLRLGRGRLRLLFGGGDMQQIPSQIRRTRGDQHADIAIRGLCPQGRG